MFATIGSIGKTHGVKAKPSPAKNSNNNANGKCSVNPNGSVWSVVGSKLKSIDLAVFATGTVIAALAAAEVFATLLLTIDVLLTMLPTTLAGIVLAVGVPVAVLIAAVFAVGLTVDAATFIGACVVGSVGLVLGLSGLAVGIALPLAASLSMVNGTFSGG